MPELLEGLTQGRPPAWRPGYTFHKWSLLCTIVPSWSHILPDHPQIPEFPAEVEERRGQRVQVLLGSLCWEWSNSIFQCAHSLSPATLLLSVSCLPVASWTSRSPVLDFLLKHDHVMKQRGLAGGASSLGGSAAQRWTSFYLGEMSALLPRSCRATHAPQCALAVSLPLVSCQQALA